jgi:hypothetical protein
MRLRWGFAVLALVLGGCETQSAMPQTNLQNQNCAAVAEGRARDAGLNGYDGDMQKQIYDATYKECVAWAQKNSIVVVEKH